MSDSINPLGSEKTWPKIGQVWQVDLLGWCPRIGWLYPGDKFLIENINYDQVWIKTSAGDLGRLDMMAFDMSKGRTYWSLIE